MKQNFNKEYWQTVWEKFKAGDRQAFETIYNEFINALYAYGSKITSDRHLLEDAIQDLFVDIYTYGKSLRQPEYLEYYLFKTLKNILIKKFKENKKFSSSEKLSFHLTFPVEETDEDELNHDKQFQLLQQEMKNLDKKKREILFLKFNSGLTYNEIGKLLNVKPDTVKKQVQRLLLYFQKKFAETSNGK